MSIIGMNADRNKSSQSSVNRAILQREVVTHDEGAATTALSEFNGLFCRVSTRRQVDDALKLEECVYLMRILVVPENTGWLQKLPIADVCYDLVTLLVRTNGDQ